MKISFIGSGSVTCSTAFMLGIKNICNEIVLLDINENFAKGKAIDLQQGFIMTGNNINVIGTSSYEYVKNSDVIVITAGVADKSGKSNREELLGINKGIIEQIATSLKEVIPTDEKQPLIIMVTNPLDIILKHFIDFGGFNKKKTIGSGNWLDTARFKYYLSKNLNVPFNNISTITMGQHGAKMVYLLTQTNINGQPLLEYIKEKNISIDKIKDICEQATAGSNEIISLLAKEGTIFGPAVSIHDIIKSYIKNEDKLLIVSVYCHGEYGVKDLCIGCPVMFNGNGIKYIIEYNINKEEKNYLKGSVDFIKSF